MVFVHLEWKIVSPAYVLKLADYGSTEERDSCRSGHQFYELSLTALCYLRFLIGLKPNHTCFRQVTE